MPNTKNVYRFAYFRVYFKQFEYKCASDEYRTHGQSVDSPENNPRHHECLRLVGLNFEMVIDFAEINTSPRY